MAWGPLGVVPQHEHRHVEEMLDMSMSRSGWSGERATRDDPAGADTVTGNIVIDALLKTVGALHRSRHDGTAAVGRADYLRPVVNIAREGHEPAATEVVLRSNAVALQSLAAQHGISQLRVAGPGRLVGHIGEDRDLFDVAAFETAAQELVGAEVELYSDGVLEHDNVSPELLTATPL